MLIRRKSNCSIRPALILFLPEFADVLKTYYAEPLFRDAATMNVEDPAEVEELKKGLAE